MKKWAAMGLSVLFALAVMAAAVPASQKAAEGKPQTICPVMGGQIDKNVYADYQGKRVYFCCASCKKQFLQDPEPYLKKLQDDGVILEKSPAQ